MQLIKCLTQVGIPPPSYNIPPPPPHTLCVRIGSNVIFTLAASIVQNTIAFDDFPRRS
jgi:hypothetical protein